jgi:hypothetical protein
MGNKADKSPMPAKIREYKQNFRLKKGTITRITIVKTIS